MNFLKIPIQCCWYKCDLFFYVFTASWNWTVELSLKELTFKLYFKTNSTTYAVLEIISLEPLESYGVVLTVGHDRSLFPVFILLLSIDIPSGLTVILFYWLFKCKC